MVYKIQCGVCSAPPSVGIVGAVSLLNNNHYCQNNPLHILCRRVRPRRRAVRGRTCRPKKASSDPAQGDHWSSASYSTGRSPISTPSRNPSPLLCYLVRGFPLCRCVEHTPARGYCSSFLIKLLSPKNEVTNTEVSLPVSPALPALHYRTTTGSLTHIRETQTTCGVCARRVCAR